jgi:hypothetical protein
VTVKALDKLVNKLNEISGVEFVRDAWVNKAPENYGVVEMSGEVSQLWADGHLTDSIWRVVVTLYVAGDDDTYPGLVQAKLEALEAAGHLDFTHMVSREYVYDINKVKWTWQINLYGSLTWEEETPVTGGDG